jgi:alpha-tubulin suppressor-like RCC1 family protein
VTSTLGADCWGQFVGDGGSLATMHPQATPVLNLPANSVSQVSAGLGGCALVRTGGLATELRCWGANKDGELGNGNTTDATKAVKVKGLSNSIEAVSNGGVYNCALVHNGGARCWGYNGYGQLGNGTTTSSSTPVAVQGLPINLARIGTGFDHACALLTDGTVQCWGRNNHGQLGNGSTSDSSTPVAVTGLTGVAQIAVGDAATCALTNAGSVQCWGANAVGQLGNGSTTDSSVPVQVSGLTGGVVAIASSDSAVCAALFTGQVDCWGDNLRGELGTGSVGSPAMSDTPVTVGGFTSNGSISISAGFGATSCALSSSQQAYCWGDNFSGQLGDGTSGNGTDSGTPVPVQGL